MTKKRLVHFLALLILVGLMSPIPISAQEIDGVYYYLDSRKGEAAVRHPDYYGSYTGVVKIPSSVEYGGKVYSVTKINSQAFQDYTEVTSVTIGNSVKEIDSEAFSGCTGLISVTIGNSVERIGHNAFSGCTGLTVVVIPNSVKYLGGHDEGGAFDGCTHLTSVTIGNFVKAIGQGTFRGCTGLASIIIPNSVETIESQAFYGCSALTFITIGNAVKEIKYQAFKGCTSLSSVTIPKSVETIGYQAFTNCNSLKKVGFLCSGSISIDEEAFDETVMFEVLNSKLLATLAACGAKEVAFTKGYEETGMTHWSEWTTFEKIYAEDTTPPMIGDSFSDFQKKNLRVIVPTIALEAYKNASVWKDFVFLRGGAETTGVKTVTNYTTDVDFPVYEIDGTLTKTIIPGHIYIRGGKKFVVK